MPTENPTAIRLTLDDQEAAFLQQMLEQALIDTHVERRRTEAPAFQDQVERQENLIRALLDKVRHTHP
jgi:hypothetical protein